MNISESVAEKSNVFSIEFLESYLLFYRQFWEVVGEKSFCNGFLFGRKREAGRSIDARKDNLRIFDQRFILADEIVSEAEKVKYLIICKQNWRVFIKYKMITSISTYLTRHGWHKATIGVQCSLKWLGSYLPEWIKYSTNSGKVVPLPFREMVRASLPRLNILCIFSPYLFWKYKDDL